MIEHYQAAVFKDDFESERRDRERAAGEYDTDKCRLEGWRLKKRNSGGNCSTRKLPESGFKMKINQLREVFTCRYCRFEVTFTSVVAVRLWLFSGNWIPTFTLRCYPFPSAKMLEIR